MGKLKKILLIGMIVFSSIVILPFLIAMFVPTEFNSERSIVIDRPQEEVFEYVRYVRNQDHFGVWQLGDPHLQASEEGVDGTVGYTYTWDGEKSGKGSQRITAIDSPSRVDMELDFHVGEPVRAFFITEAISPSRTKVTWGMQGETPYPWNAMNLFFDVGKDFEKGLENLKAILEE